MANTKSNYANLKELTADQLIDACSRLSAQLIRVRTIAEDMKKRGHKRGLFIHGHSEIYGSATESELMKFAGKVEGEWPQALQPDYYTKKRGRPRPSPASTVSDPTKSIRSRPSALSEDSTSSPPAKPTKKPRKRG